mmetsp:Transcript_17442/g.17541  ORF Transcript_17442/g.17541 Transcript_17442/m.17541 type:complete len:249 (+) Transcript_17442:138-884(+)
MAITITTSDTDTGASSSPLLTSIDRLTVASKKAVEVVNRFANIEPPLDDDDDEADLEAERDEEEEDDTSRYISSMNPWKNPQVIEEELNIARNELNAAWKNVKAERDAVTSAAVTEAYEVEDDEEKKEEDEDNEIPEEEFRVLYMNMMTDAFGDVLETMNQESGQEGKPTVDVDILVDCLQSGIDFLDPVEELNKRSYFDSLDYNFGEDDDDDIDDKMNDDNNDNDEEGLTIHEMKQRSLGYLVSSSS